MGVAAGLWGEYLATVRFLRVPWLQHWRLWDQWGRLNSGGRVRRS